MSVLEHLEPFVKEHVSVTFVRPVRLVIAEQLNHRTVLVTGRLESVTEDGLSLTVTGYACHPADVCAEVADHVVEWVGGPLFVPMGNVMTVQGFVE